MIFIKRRIEIHKNRSGVEYYIPENRSGVEYYIPAFAVLSGAITYLLLMRNNSFLVNCDNFSGYISVCCCMLALLLISLSGLCIAGSVMIFCFDYLLGFFASAGVCGLLSKGEMFSLAWLCWAFYIFALIFCTLFISSFSKKFSTELFRKVKGDGKFRTKLIEFLAVCLLVIVLITSVFFAVYKLKPEFFM